VTSAEPGDPATRLSLGDAQRAAPLDAAAPSEMALVRRAPAEAHQIAGMRTAVVTLADACGMTEAARADIALAVSEACTNVVMHAYIDAPAPGSLIVAASHQGGELVVAVRDEGRGMLARTDSPGLGLGMSLIGRLSQRLEIRQNGACGTEVRMSFAGAIGR
jgi:anti-sigma regulatory factor (Ser/Thr protein kinase)